MPDPEIDAGTSEPAEAASESTVETATPTQDATGTTADTPTTGSEESFFDPSALPEDLVPAYKQMQGHFTRRMQAIKKEADKIAAYNAFQANPQATLKQLAGQYGLTLQEAAQAAQGGSEFEPQDWNDVTEHIKSAVIQQIQPALAEIRSVKQSSIEQQLDATMPEWREYEEPMQELLSRHPTLADDPVTLARMAIPETVQQSKAMQAAMRKLEAKAKQSAATRGTEVTKGADTSKPPKGASFQDTVAWAKAHLAAKGG